MVTKCRSCKTEMSSVVV